MFHYLYSILDLFACLNIEYKKHGYLSAQIFTHNLSCRYPSYCGSNIWPDSALPELEVGMCSMIFFFFAIVMLKFF